jgi:aminoglycoside phosphotransferase family enzyme/predicted kinase
MDDQKEVISFLADGASYGKPSLTVERIETHVSIVFLIDDRAYKLKRAVSFSYLDFSTIALRERFCRAELALNRRTAAALYLGVRAITRGADGNLAFDGDGSAVDWVLEMQRFRQSDLFDHLAESRTLTPELMRDLTDVIAAFHAAAEVTPEHGGRAGIEKTIAGNHANLVKSCPPFEARQVERLNSASMARLAAIGAGLDARRGSGRVRRCHGDLHLRNVCLFDGRPTLFDCIEFSDAISCIDVLYDLAFLLMDLVHRDLSGLANIVFNRYLDLTVDLDGLSALPLFMSVRAAVRAHVSAARNRQKPSSRTLQDAHSYLSLAGALLGSHPPRLIAIGGLSGVGKSTLAQALAPGFLPAPGARVIRSDILRKRLFYVAPETRLPRSAYGAATTERVYRALHDQAAATLAAGYSAIVDATFLREEERQHIAACAERDGVAFVGLWLAAPRDVLAARISARGRDPSDADALVLSQQLEVDTGVIAWHRIDATGDSPASLAAAQGVIGLPAAGVRSISA